MTFDVQTLGLDHLTVHERLQLVDIIFESLPKQVGPEELSDEQMGELIRRRKEVDDNPRVGRPWQELIADLRKKP